MTTMQRVPLGVAVPDEVFWDWRLGTRGLCVRHGGKINNCPNAARQKSSKRQPRIDWFWGIVRLEVVRQRTNRLVLADTVLANILWGSRPRAKNWRKLLELRLRRAGGTATLVNLKTLGECPEGCSQQRAGPHRHFLLTIPSRSLGELHRHALVVTAGNVHHYHFCFQSQRPGGLWAFYLPLVLFGQHLGLTARQVRLAVSFCAEITRQHVHGRRKDKAEVLRSSHEGPLPGRWVACQGNDPEKPPYSLGLRCRRAYYSGREELTASRVKRFLQDLCVLKEKLGIHLLLRNDKFEDVEPLSILPRLRGDRVPPWLMPSPLSVWLPASYRSCWRRQIEQATGLRLEASRPEDDPMEQLRQQLRLYAGRTGQSTKNIAIAAGVHRNNLTNFLSKKTSLRKATVQKLQELLEQPC